MLKSGIQLYTLRDQMAKDFYGTIKRVADIGYKGVEFAGLYDEDPKKVREYIDSLGLTCHSCHEAFPTTENADKIAETLKTLGTDCWVGGVGGDAMDTEEKFNKTIEEFAKACEIAESKGLKFFMHNHWWEFYYKVDGVSFYDAVMSKCPTLNSELDVFWTVVGGGCPVSTIRKYGDKISLIHSKDGILTKPWNPGDAFEMKANGEGIVPIKDCIETTKSAKWAIMELDEVNGDMWEAVEKSYNYLTKVCGCEGTK